MNVPPHGSRCAWCEAADWEYREQAVQVVFYGPLFHDRGGGAVTVLSDLFDPAFFDSGFFDFSTTTVSVGGQNSSLPGPCYANAVAAGVTN